MTHGMKEKAVQLGRHGQTATQIDRELETIQRNIMKEPKGNKGDWSVYEETLMVRRNRLVRAPKFPLKTGA